MRVLTLLFPVAVIADLAHGQCECWIEPDTSYTQITNSMWYIPSGAQTTTTPPDDGTYGPITLPFAFQFFGVEYDTVYINTNGNLTFGWPTINFNPFGFPNGSYTMIAPFWADVDLRPTCPGCNRVDYRLTPTALYVSWSRVGYWNFRTDKLNTFQVVISDGADPAIPDGNNVSFCYGDMQWATSDGNGGQYGFDGIPATTGANQPDGLNPHYAQVGRFRIWGSDYAGPYDEQSGISWLDSSHFVFNTVDTSGVPPIFAWQFDCDTIIVEVGQEFEYEMMVLAGGPGQIVSMLSECATLSSYTELASVQGELAMITSYMAPDAGDVGFHAVNYVAQNDLVEPTSSSGTLVVQVVPAQTTGVPVPSGGPRFILQSPVDDVLRFTLSADAHARFIEVLSLDGRVLRRNPLPFGASSGTIEMQDLPSGAYLLRSGGIVGRFVKD